MTPRQVQIRRMLRDDEATALRHLPAPPHGHNALVAVVRVPITGELLEYLGLDLGLAAPRWGSFVIETKFRRESLDSEWIAEWHQLWEKGAGVGDQPLLEGHGAFLDEVGE